MRRLLDWMLAVLWRLTVGEFGRVRRGTAPRNPEREEQPDPWAIHTIYAESEHEAIEELTR